MTWPASVRYSIAALTLLAGPAGAASYCDPALEQKSDSPMAYRMRGDRCEGSYAQKVSSVSLEVRSFVESFGSFDPAKDSELVLTWKAPSGVDGTGNVRLRALSFKPRTYFRMDTAQPAAKGSYRWPTEILAGERLGRDDLGILAWTELPGPAGRNREVYLPLRAGAKAAAAADQGYDVTLVPSARLREVRVTLSRIDSRGTVLNTLRRNEELNYGYYPPDKPTVFATGKLGASGFYRLQVTAAPASGLPVDCEIDFYHAGD